MSENEQIVLEPTTVICGRHGEPFKPRWPAGYVRFSVMALEALLADETFATDVRHVVESETFPDITNHMEAVRYLIQRRPICCRLGAEKLLAVYEELNKVDSVWEPRHCVLCGRHRPGSAFRVPIQTRVLNPKVKEWRHVCLRCVTHGQGK